MINGKITMSSSAKMAMIQHCLANGLQPDVYLAAQKPAASNGNAGRTDAGEGFPPPEKQVRSKPELTGGTGKNTGYTRSIFQWLDDVAADPGLTASAFKVAYAITQHINKDSGEAFPSIDRIAGKIAMSVGTVVAGIRQLEKAGWLEKEPGSLGRGHSHRYRIRQKTSAR